MLNLRVAAEQAGQSHFFDLIDAGKARFSVTLEDLALNSAQVFRVIAQTHFPSLSSKVTDGLEEALAWVREPNNEEQLFSGNPHSRHGLHRHKLIFYAQASGSLDVPGKPANKLRAHAVTYPLDCPDFAADIRRETENMVNMYTLQHAWDGKPVNFPGPEEIILGFWEKGNQEAVDQLIGQIYWWLWVKMVERAENRRETGQV